MNCEIKSKYSNKESHNNISKDVYQGLKLNTDFFINPNTKCNKVLWNVKYNLQGKKNVPCCHKPPHAVALSRDQSRSRRKHALRYLAQDFPIQNHHGRARRAGSPISARDAANKRELINLPPRLQRRGCPGWERRVGLLAGAGSQLPRYGVPGTAQRLSAPIWTLRCPCRSWRGRSRENQGLAGRLFLDYRPSCSPGVSDINTPNRQHKGGIWIA